VAAHPLFQILDDLVPVPGLFAEQSEDDELDLSGLEHGPSVASALASLTPLESKAAGAEPREQIA
jgi:hypothetical protein